MALLLGNDAIKREKKYGAFEILSTKPFSSLEYISAKYLSILFLLLLVTFLSLVLFCSAQLYFAEDFSFRFEFYLFYYALCIVIPLLFVTAVALLLGAIAENVVVFFFSILLSLIGVMLFYSIIFLDKLHINISFLFSLYLYSPLAIGRRGFAFSDIILNSKVMHIIFFQRFIYVLSSFFLIYFSTCYLKRIIANKKPKPLPEKSQVRDFIKLYRKVKDHIIPDISLLKAKKLKVLALFALLLAAILSFGFLGKHLKEIEIKGHRDYQLALKKYADYPLLSVQHYDLDMEVFLSRREIEVDSTIYLRNQNDKPVDKIIFMLNPSLHIERIAYENSANPLSFKRLHNIIEAKPDKAIEIGEEGRMSVNYRGKLDQRYKDYLILKEELKSTGLWAEDYTYPIYTEFIQKDFTFLPAILYWYPSFEKLQGVGSKKEKRKNFFTATINIIVPQKLRALAPGQLIKNRTDNKKASYIWQTEGKISELIVVMGKYELYTKDVSDRKVNIFYYAEHKANFENIKDAVDNIIRFLAEHNYSPFSSFTIIEMPQILYDEEYTKNIKVPGIILLSEEQFYPLRKSKYFNIYLQNFNKKIIENFEPSFTPQLYNAKGEGTVFLEKSIDAYFSELFGYAISIDPSKYMKSTVQPGGKARNLYQNMTLLEIYEEPKHQFDKLPEALIYGKGPKLLHTLRFLLGEEAFWKSLEAFFRKYQYGNPTLEDFENTIINTSEKELRWFFSQYLRGTALPKYEITEALAYKKEDSYQLQINIKNIGSGDMLLPFVIETLGEKVSREIWIEDKGEVIVKLSTKEEPVKVLIDPEHKVYRQRNPGFGDRKEVEIFK